MAADECACAADCRSVFVAQLPVESSRWLDEELSDQIHYRLSQLAVEVVESAP
jgi:hypothetical protein